VAEESDLRRELDAARATVASQAMQIHQLEQRAQGAGALGILRELLELSDIVGVTVGQTPYRRLLNGITEAARRLFNAGAASILLLDEETNELVFEAATGGGDVIGRRFPAHQGIAGWTVMSGEPIAVGDVRRDPRWASNFAASTGYIPKSILSVPMFLEDEVAGVLQVLDKANNASFGLDDMELLGLFSNPAAIAVEQARMVTTIGKLLTQEVERMARDRGETDMAQAARTVVAEGATTPDQTLELAHLVHTLSKRGDKARTLAIEVLTSISKFS
jgi:GAF domain-containing protein